MSDLEDWDFDEDFLKDVDDKAVGFYSQVPGNKRLKLDFHKQLLTSENNSANNQLKTTNNGDKLSIRHGNNQRKSFILNTLKEENSSCPREEAVIETKCTSNSTSLNTPFNSNKCGEYSEVLMNTDITTSRKHMIFDILRKKGMSVSEDKSRDVSSIKDKEPQEISIKLNKQAVSLSMEHEDKFSSPFPLKRPAKLKDDLQCSKVTLIRKFAGPAGLLPDIMHDQGISAVLLNDIEQENNSKVESTDLTETNCWSQNTRNLFTKGAWQVMLDSLSEHVKKKVNDNKISLILQSARKQFKQNVKVEYFAGIVENLQCHNNLVHFTIKDSTGSIPAVIFYDVSVRYPDIFCNSAVILLRSVTVTRIFQSTQYRFVITQNNIQGIYSDKGQIDKFKQLSDNINTDLIVQNTLSTNIC